MKKIFIGLVTLIIGCAVFFTLADLATSAAPDMAKNIATKAGYDTASQDQYSLSRTIGGIIRAVLSMIGVIFMVLTLYAGVLWMTAAGNEDKVQKATSILKSSMIGLLIVVAAYGLTALVMTFVIGASAPTTDTGSYPGPERALGCCREKPANSDGSFDECTQVAYPEECSAEYGSKGEFISDEYCENPDLKCNSIKSLF